MDSFMLNHLRKKAERDSEEQDFPLTSWTTTLEEDQKLLEMAEDENEDNLQKIVSFRIRLKESYTSGEDNP